jgi:hypothetical protein
MRPGEQERAAQPEHTVAGDPAAGTAAGQQHRQPGAQAHPGQLADPGPAVVAVAVGGERQERLPGFAAVEVAWVPSSSRS